MFYLWQEEFDSKHPKMQVFKYDQLAIQQYCNYQDLDASIQQSRDLSDYEHYFLLDESRFHFFRFDMYREMQSPFTIDDYNQILQQKISYLKTITKEELLFTHIDNIYVQWQPQKFLIWAKGQVYFRLCLIYINRNTLLEFNRNYGDVFEHKNLHIYPETFKTISFLKRKLERDNFYLLYIKEWICKIIQVEQGFYKRIESINLGVAFLMQMYRENQIVKYRYKSHTEIEGNPLAKALVLETVGFYTQQICKWLESLGLTEQDLFLISPIVKNPYFLELFNKFYGKFHSRYIVPFHSSSSLQTFDRERDSGDIDLLIFLNSKRLRTQLLEQKK